MDQLTVYLMVLRYYKNWRKDEDVWKKILPGLEAAIKSRWSYNAPVDEDIPDESFEKQDLVNSTVNIEPGDINE